MSKYSKEDMHGCAYCLFVTENPDECVVVDEVLIKPGPIKDFSDCPFYVRASHFQRMPEEMRSDLMEERKVQMLKYKKLSKK